MEKELLLRVLKNQYLIMLGKEGREYHLDDKKVDTLIKSIDLGCFKEVSERIDKIHTGEREGNVMLEEVLNIMNMYYNIYIVYSSQNKKVPEEYKFRGLDGNEEHYWYLKFIIKDLNLYVNNEEYVQKNILADDYNSHSSIFEMNEYRLLLHRFNNIKRMKKSITISDIQQMFKDIH